MSEENRGENLDPIFEQEYGFDQPENQREKTPQENIRQRVIDVFSEDPRVKFAIAMGSSAEGKENRLSDVDICVVMNDDAELNEILSELNELFPQFGKMVGYYQYNPYHFYVIFEPNAPLDIYFISSSLYFTVKSDKNKIIVDHSKRDLGKVKKDFSPEMAGPIGEKKEGLSPEEVVKDLFLKGFIRTFRLLSKIEKEDYTTLAYILNRIREEQIIPLLTSIDGYDIPHAKAIKLESFSPDLRVDFTETYCKPEEKSCINAVVAAAKIMKELFDKASQNFNLEDLRSFVEETYEQIRNYTPQRPEGKN